MHDQNRAEAHRGVRSIRVERIAVYLGIDIVPCPECGAVSKAMRATRRRNRLDGLGVAGMGLVAAATHRLFYVIGVDGVVVCIVGVVMIFSGLGHAFTGKVADNASAATKGSATEAKQRG